MQILEFMLRERPPMPAGQIAEPKISDSNTQKMFDAVSDGLKHAPNLPIYSLPQDNAKTRRREGTKARNLRALAIKNNSAQQLWSKRRIPRSIQCDLILLVDLETGVGESLGQFAIVRQKQQTFCLRIETSDIEESRKFFRQEIKDRVARMEIFSSRNESAGFMQHDRKGWSAANKFMIDLDVVARLCLRTEVCADLAIDCYAAGSDQLIAMPT
ncbi:MAG: hypothetical protein Udaeo2_16340 [Candidatus Udaeobacter sp.]|nr:MAG: hypothetical protein Udaeo2_16340 [Candidatus Udaeobacter sp.]